MSQDPGDDFQSPCDGCTVWQAYLEVGAMATVEPERELNPLQSAAYRRLSIEEEAKCMTLAFGNRIEEDNTYVLDSSECEGGKKRLRFSVDRKWRFRKICQGKVKVIPVVEQ